MNRTEWWRLLLLLLVVPPPVAMLRRRQLEPVLPGSDGGVGAPGAVRVNGLSGFTVHVKWVIWEGRRREIVW